MEIKIQIPDYSPGSGFTFCWEGNFEIRTRVEHGEIVISANKAGLVSLANHLLNLAQDDVPVGTHIHLDEFNYALEEGSVPLVIEKRVG
jgi:hypothetical protein